SPRVAPSNTRSPGPPEERGNDRRRHGERGEPGRAPHPRQVPGGYHRIRWQPVHLRLVEQEEERAGAADAVVRVGAVELRAGLALLVESREAGLSALAQLVERPVLDRLGRARLGTGR